MSTPHQNYDTFELRITNHRSQNDVLFDIPFGQQMARCSMRSVSALGTKLTNTTIIIC